MVETAVSIQNDIVEDHNESKEETSQNDDEALVLVDAKTNTKRINRSAYVKLQRSSLSGTAPTSLNKLKDKFESNSSDDTDLMKARGEKVSASDGRRQDVNSNHVGSSEDEEHSIILRDKSSESEEDIVNQLNEFITMEPKVKEKRKTKLRRIFSWLGKDKKKNQGEEPNKYRHSDFVNNDNSKNETNSFSRDTRYRHTIMTDTRVNHENVAVRNKPQRDAREEQKFARQHIENFDHIRRSFDKNSQDNQIKPNKNSLYANTPYLAKYVDVNVSTSESDKENPFVETRNPDSKITLKRHPSSSNRDTPPRAQETRQNVKVVSPKDLVPNPDRPLPNPLQNGTQIQVQPRLEETYGTVFDSIDKRASLSKSPTVPQSKLKLPSNRDIVQLEPRKSPLPHNSVSSDKIIATELLKKCSPLPEKKMNKKNLSPSHHNLELDFEYSLEDIRPKGPRKPARLMLDVNSAPGCSSPPTLPKPYLFSVSPSPEYHYTRQRTPVNDYPMPQQQTTSPQKDEMRRNVEKYYWNEVQKMKEAENSKFETLYQSKLALEGELMMLRRSRSLSPNTDRARRSLSLPRTVQTQYVQGASGNSYIVSPDYNNGRAIVNLRNPTATSSQQYINVNPNFVRNSPDQRTVDNYENYSGTLYRPIFRRGSLTKQPPPTTDQQLNKKVSFSRSKSNSNGSWPTKNGYTTSPPQRRTDKVESPMDDDVFLPHLPNPSIYATKSEMLQMRLRNQQEHNAPVEYRHSPQGLTRHGSITVHEQIYADRPYNNRRMSFDSVHFPDQQQPVHRQQPTAAPLRRREIIIDNDGVFGTIGGYSGQPRQEPIYGQQYRDPRYNKQVNVRNKVCDFYGQIHDKEDVYGEKSAGVMMGQLQYSPNSPSAMIRNKDPFVRGTRFTASAHDLDYHKNMHVGEVDPNRPLPPIPKGKSNFRTVSDTESISEIEEARRVAFGKEVYRCYLEMRNRRPQVNPGK